MSTGSMVYFLISLSGMAKIRDFVPSWNEAANFRCMRRCNAAPSKAVLSKCDHHKKALMFIDCIYRLTWEMIILR